MKTEVRKDVSLKRQCFRCIGRKFGTCDSDAQASPCRNDLKPQGGGKRQKSDVREIARQTSFEAKQNEVNPILPNRKGNITRSGQEGSVKIRDWNKGVYRGSSKSKSDKDPLNMKCVELGRRLPGKNARLRT